MRKAMGLEHARPQGHTIQSIHPHIASLRPKYPKAGARDMVTLLFQERGILVPRYESDFYFYVRAQAHI